MPITFRQGASWLAVSQLEVGRLMQANHELPTWLRVFFAGLADANRIGHAEYGPGGLRDRLRVVDSSTGAVLADATDSAVSNAIKKAKESHLLAHDSSARCLVLPHTLAQKDAKGTNSCRYHKVNVEGAAGPLPASSAHPYPGNFTPQ